MAISTTQEGILASELKSLGGKELMKKLNTLKGGVTIAGYRSKIPAIKDPANYGSNYHLIIDCYTLPVDKALDTLEKELKLIMTHNPWVFSIYTLQFHVNEYTMYHAEFSQTILSALTHCIETLLKRINIAEINYENLHRICNFIYSINMVIENHPNHITQDCVIIEQSYAGESYNELLGTRGTLTCVCIAIQDMTTGKVYFAHVDNIVTKESIEKTIEISFPNSNNLIARLFGGILNNKTTMENTKKIIDALPPHVKIISSDIENIELDNLNRNCYSISPTFVVNPKTFEVTNSCPVHLTNDVISFFTLFNDSYVSKLIQGKNYSLPISCYKKLHMSYTKSQYTPSLITGSYIYLHAIIDYRASLNSILYNLEKENDILKKLKHCFPYDLLFSLEIGKVVDLLMQKVQNAAKRKNITLSQNNMYDIMANLTFINLHIGPNASEANKPIFDFIENHLFTNNNTLDLDGLSKIQMGHDSHCYLEPAKDISKTTADESMESPVEDMELSIDLHSR